MNGYWPTNYNPFGYWMVSYWLDWMPVSSTFALAVILAAYGSRCSFSPVSGDQGERLALAAETAQIGNRIPLSIEAGTAAAFPVASPVT